MRSAARAPRSRSRPDRRGRAGRGVRFVVAEGASSGKPAWWLVGDDGRRIAWSGRPFDDHAKALAACVAFKSKSNTFTYEVYLDTREQPRWRVRDRLGRTLALASDSFATKSLAVHDAHAVKDGARYAEGP